MKDFSDKTAVITGGASGIGRAMGALFLDKGMNVVLADIEQKAVKGDGDGEPGKDEIGGVVERVADCLGIAEGAIREDRDRLERIFAKRQN